MQTTNISAQDDTRLLMPDALRIAALERQVLHEKIVRLRALREAAEAEKVLTVRNSGLSRSPRFRLCRKGPP
jgi:hypothetical protein